MKTDGVKEVFDVLKEVLGESENAESLKSILSASLQHETYGKSFQDLMVQLLGEYGLLVLNMDNQDLKRSFIPHIEKEIFEQPSQNYILKAQADIEAAGFKAQAYPREINFFHLGENYRERIVFENDQYQINGQDISFTEAELKAEIQNHPERFSPNVIMRPIYQEFCLPNLAYIGGGGEIAYWLERKTQFAHFGVNFPMLIRRNSAMWIDKGSVKNMEKLNFSTSDLFRHEHDLVKQFLKDVATEDLDLKAEIEELKSIYEKIQARALRINPGLEKSVIAESVKNIKQFESIESKMVKAEKKKNEVDLNRINKLKEKLFPGDSLQERKNNFMEIYLKHGVEFFEILLEELNPLEEGFVIFVE
jgi:bacillithiol biosynthesis cysteine-adding enzyme BshC